MNELTFSMKSTLILKDLSKLYAGKNDLSISFLSRRASCYSLEYLHLRTSWDFFSSSVKLHKKTATAIRALNMKCKHGIEFLSLSRSQSFEQLLWKME